jgi:hypothetical protein
MGHSMHGPFHASLTILLIISIYFKTFSNTKLKSEKLFIYKENTEKLLFLQKT